MSSFAYGALTGRRVAASQNTSFTTTPGIKVYADTLAALVPAEAIALSGFLTKICTKTQPTNDDSSPLLAVTEPTTLKWAFVGLLVLAPVLYALGRLAAGGAWKKADWIRLVIPAAAFWAWAMLQNATGFDVFFPDLRDVPRLAIAAFASVALAALAAALAYKADKDPAA